MENSNEVTVQIKVREYNEGIYEMVGLGCLIPKSYCTVIPTSVEEKEGEVKGSIQKLISYFEQQLRLQRSSEIKYTTEEALVDAIDVCRNLIKTEMPASEPKLIAKAGEYMELVSSNYNGHAIEFKRPYKLEQDFIEGGRIDFCGYGFGSEYIHRHEMKFEPCPSPSPIRTPIGTYEGVEIFDGDIGYLVTYDDMKINTYVFRKVSFMGGNLGDTQFSSKVYLTPEAVNARLSSEVEKKAMERGLTWNQMLTWFESNTCISITDYAIGLIEKEFNVKYL